MQRTVYDLEGNPRGSLLIGEATTFLPNNNNSLLTIKNLITVLNNSFALRG